MHGKLLFLFWLLATSMGACASPERSEERAPGEPALVVSRSVLQQAAIPLTGAASDYRPLAEALAGARFILLGESTHGGSEYYRERFRISRQLIEQGAIGAILIEGDWSPTARVNLYVRGLGSDRSAEEALSGYREFPAWMWRNAEFRDFISWLRARNLAVGSEERIGVYGMDVYDLFDAADAAVAYLKSRDPAAAARAQQHYRCFRSYRRSTAAYGEATRRPGRSCKAQAEAAAREFESIVPAPGRAEEHFLAQRSAASVMAAEEYFRAAYAETMAWNRRELSMRETVEAAAEHVSKGAGLRRTIIWAHNSHVGDARATGGPLRGETSLGQLMRERHAGQAFLIGFLGGAGSTRAAAEWGGPSAAYTLKPPVEASYEQLFRRAGVGNSLFLLRGNSRLQRELAGPLLQRGIGVVYGPVLQTQFFPATLPQQFDAFIYLQSISPTVALR